MFIYILTNDEEEIRIAMSTTMPQNIWDALLEIGYTIKVVY